MHQQYHIATLEHTPIAELADAFNTAFSDYKIRLQLTPVEMALKIRSEGIVLSHSVGAYEGRQLVSFILHGVDAIGGVPLVYNAGTGTHPGHRNRGLAQQLYRFIIPHLAGKGICRHRLEVFDDNAAAINVYTRMGFSVVRSFNCYRGRPVAAPQHNFRIDSLPPDEALLRSFWSYTPSWQNDLPAIRRNLDAHQVVGIRVHDRVAAYAIYMPANGRLRQLAVGPAFRRQGMGTALLHYIGQQCGGVDLLVTNVEDDVATDTFFRRRGLEHFLRLHEMELEAAPVSTP